MSGLISIRDSVDIYSVNSRTVITGFTSTVRDVSQSQSLFLGFDLTNNDATTAWLQIFFKPSSNVVLGTTAPDITIKFGGNESRERFYYYPIRCIGGFSVAATTTETGSTSVTLPMTGVIYYKA